MKKIILLLASVLLFVHCKKEEAPAAPQSRKLKSIYTSTYNQDYTFDGNKWKTFKSYDFSNPVSDVLIEYDQNDRPALIRIKSLDTADAKVVYQNNTASIFYHLPSFDSVVYSMDNGRITKRESYGKKSNGLIFKRALQEYQYQGNNLTKLYFKRYDETGAIEYQSELNASYDAQKNALESSGDQLLLRDYLGGRTTFYNGLSQNNLVELTEVGTNFYQKLTCDYQYDSEGYPVEFDLKTENSNGISTQHFWLEYY